METAGSWRHLQPDLLRLPRCRRERSRLSLNGSPSNCGQDSESQESCETGPATRLTQTRKREARGVAYVPENKAAIHPHSVCRTCGKPIVTGRRFCADCAVPRATENILEAARAARPAAHSVEARAKRADTVRHHRKEQAAWSPSTQPTWLTEDFYITRIRPALAFVSNSTVASLLGISRCHASQVRSGKRRAHPRHWQTLAQLTGFNAQ